MSACSGRWKDGWGNTGDGGRLPSNGYAEDAMIQMLNKIGQGISALEKAMETVLKSQETTQMSILQLKQNMPIFTRGMADTPPPPSLTDLDGLMKRHLSPLGSSIANLQNQISSTRGLPALPDGSPQQGSLRNSADSQSSPPRSETQSKTASILEQFKALGSTVRSPRNSPRQQVKEPSVKLEQYPSSDQITQELGAFRQTLVADIQSMFREQRANEDKASKALQDNIAGQVAVARESPFQMVMQNNMPSGVAPPAYPYPQQDAGAPMVNNGIAEYGDAYDGKDGTQSMDSLEPETIQEVVKRQEAEIQQVEDEIRRGNTAALDELEKNAAHPLGHHTVVGDEPVIDENAHKKIVLKESSSMAAVFSNDDDVERPIYDVTAFYYDSGCCQSVARSDKFNNFTVFVVCLNAIYIGVDADHNNAENIFDAHWFFMISSNLFAVYFTFELVVRMLAFRRKRDCFKDGWFKFDLFLVTTMILDTWVLSISLKIIGGGSAPIPVQPLRMLRLAKLTRMARLMKAFPELVTMIKGLIRSLRAISSSGILVALMVYTWAILLHMLLKDEKELNDKLMEESNMNFETIIYCMWTLLMDGTLMLDNAAILMGELLFGEEPNLVLAGIFFLMYAVLSALLILQMLIGVLCDVVSQVGQEQRDAHAIGIVKQELLEIISTFDEGDGKISQDELFKVMKHPKSVAVLKKLNVNRPFLMELQKMMFPKPETTVPMKTILELMIMCRGENAATVETLSGGFTFLANEMEDIKRDIVYHIRHMLHDLHRNEQPQVRNTSNAPKAPPKFLKAGRTGPG